MGLDALEILTNRERTLLIPCIRSRIEHESCPWLTFFKNYMNRVFNRRVYLFTKVHNQKLSLRYRPVYYFMLVHYCIVHMFTFFK